MKLSKEAWLTAGLEILTKQGPHFVKVDHLCKAKGVTKGSFYHHFKNRDSYVKNLLEHWQKQNTQAIINQVEKAETAEQRSHALDALTISIDTGPEKAIRSWAQYDENVANFVKEVDKKRIKYVEELLRAQLDESFNTSLLAKTIYAHFVGSQQLDKLFSRKDWQAMNDLLRSLILGGKE